MNYFTDLFSILSGCLLFYGANHLGELVGTIVFAFVFAIICFVVCSQYAKLWNRLFHLTCLHVILCTMAAFCTFFFVIFFSAVGYTKDAALDAIDSWRQGIDHDQAWSNATFHEVYYKIKEQTGDNAEDFTNFPPPEKGGHVFPLNKELTKINLATVYSEDAAKNFIQSHPFLGSIFNTQTTIPQSLIKKDVNDFFETATPNSDGSRTYPVSRAIDLAADEIRRSATDQAPRVVVVARTSVVILFLIAQAIPFIAIGIAAYKDIKIRV